MDVTVLHDRVLLKRNQPEEKTLSGIVLPGALKEPVFEATVVAVGAGKPIKDSEPIPLAVKIGDQVIYNPNAVISIKFDGDDLLVTTEEEIFAVIE